LEKIGGFSGKAFRFKRGSGGFISLKELLFSKVKAVI
jgi:hypothetical protein